MASDLQSIMTWISTMMTSIGGEVILAVVGVSLLSLFLTFRR